MTLVSGKHPGISPIDGRPIGIRSIATEENIESAALELQPTDQGFMCQEDFPPLVIPEKRVARPDLGIGIQLSSVGVEKRLARQHSTKIIPALSLAELGLNVRDPDDGANHQETKWQPELRYAPSVEELAFGKYLLASPDSDESDDDWCNVPGPTPMRRTMSLFGPGYSSDNSGDGPPRRQGRARNNAGGRGRGHGNGRGPNINAALQAAAIIPLPVAPAPQLPRPHNQIVNGGRGVAAPQQRVIAAAAPPAQVLQCSICDKTNLTVYAPPAHTDVAGQVHLRTPANLFQWTCGCNTCSECAGRSAHAYYRENGKYTESVACPLCRTRTTVFGGASKDKMEGISTVVDYLTFGPLGGACFDDRFYYSPPVVRPLRELDVKLPVKSEFARKTVWVEMAFSAHRYRRRHPIIYFYLSFGITVAVTFLMCFLLDKFAFGLHNVYVHGYKIQLPQLRLYIVALVVATLQTYPYTLTAAKDRSPFFRRMLELLGSVIMIFARALVYSYLAIYAFFYLRETVHGVVVIVLFLFHTYQWLVSIFSNQLGPLDRVVDTQPQAEDYTDVDAYGKFYEGGFKYYRTATIYPDVIEDHLKQEYSNYNVTAADKQKKQDLSNSSNQYVRRVLRGQRVDNKKMADTIQYFLAESELLKEAQSVEMNSGVVDRWPCVVS